MRRVITILGFCLLHSFLFGQNNDCNLAVVLCNTSNFTSNPSGAGFDDFQNPLNNDGCLVGGEHQSEWYYFKVFDNAPPDQELTFVISPNGGQNEDYDFALYRTTGGCNNLGNPLRCSYAAPGPNCAFCPMTGLGPQGDDTFEGPSGDGFLLPIIVQPGDEFFLLIDNFLANNQGYTLNWDGPAATDLDCDAIPPCAVLVDAGIDVEVCENEPSVSLTGFNPGSNFTSSFTWSGTGISNSYLTDPNNVNTDVNIPPGFSGTLNYTLTVVDGLCSDSDEIQIEVLPNPTIVVPLQTSFCINDAPFDFPISPNGGNWSSNIPNGIVDPVALGIGDHQVFYSFNDNSDCFQEEVFTITINSAPTVSVDAIPTTCVGENSFQLIGSPIGGTWSANASNGFIDPTALGSGEQTISYTFTNPITNCSETAFQTVEILPELTLEIDGNAVFCIGGNTTLSAGTGFESYLWSDNSTSSEITVSSTGTYSVTITNQFGCTAIDFINVIEDDEFPIADAGSDMTLNCDFNSIFIGGNSSIGNNSYLWSSSDPNLEINFPNNINASINQPGNYEIMVTNNYNGCTSIDEISVFENTNLPTSFSYEVDPLICFGDQDGSVTITNVQNGTPPYSYSLDFGNYQPNNTFSYLGADTYIMTVQDANFCEYQSEVTIENPPQFSLNLGDDITISLGESTQLRVQPNYNIIDFEWEQHPTLPCIDCYDPIVSPQFQTTYFATATSEEECLTEEMITVFVEKDREIFIPNAFSPNEDGINDFLKIYTGEDVLRINSFNIFDRWGEKVYEINNLNPNDEILGWNGYLAGQKLPVGVYVYIAEITFIDGWTEFFQGDITLTK